MTGREDQQENDLFFVCSLIESLGRATKNHRRDIVKALGESEIRHILELADVYHCENPDKLQDEFIAKFKIQPGEFDNIATCRYTIPTCFDIAKVYKRLIVAVAHAQNIDFATALLEVYNSWITAKLDDYNSSMFFENPDYIFQSYLAGKPLAD